MVAYLDLPLHLTTWFFSKATYGLVWFVMLRLGAHTAQEGAIP